MSELEKLYAVNRQIPELGEASVHTVQGWIRAEIVKVVRIGRRVYLPHSEIVRIRNGGLNQLANISSNNANHAKVAA